MNDLWVLAGQSNMEGVGNLIDTEEPVASVRSFAHGDVWGTAQEPLHWLQEANDVVHTGDLKGDELAEARRVGRETRVKGAGLGLPFAKTIHERTGVAIDLLPVAHGGTSMQQWSPEHKHLAGGSLYGALLRRVKLALETGGEKQLKGILWYQGESDADDTNAPLYSGRMVHLIEQLRQDLSAPELPFYLVQLGPFSATGHDGAADAPWSSIRESQRQLPGLVAHTEAVSAIDLELDDSIHIGTYGLKRLGRRLASVALKHVYGRGTPTGPKLASIKKTAPDQIRVSYENVAAGLNSADLSGRISGFDVFVGGTRMVNPCYKCQVDPAVPTDIILYMEGLVPELASVAYGYGINPFCQLADTADMAAPAFGPISVEY